MYEKILKEKGWLAWYNQIINDIVKSKNKN